jgi:hypothetical protein
MRGLQERVLAYNATAMRERKGTLDAYNQGHTSEISKQPHHKKIRRRKHQKRNESNKENDIRLVSSSL